MQGSEGAGQVCGAGEGQASPVHLTEKACSTSPVCGPGTVDEQAVPDCPCAWTLQRWPLACGHTDRRLLSSSCSPLTLRPSPQRKLGSLGLSGKRPQHTDNSAAASQGQGMGSLSVVGRVCGHQEPPGSVPARL